MGESNDRQFSVDILEKLAKQPLTLPKNSCLQIVFDSLVFSVYLKENKLLYATNTLAPFERLERHLRRLSNRSNKLNNEIIKQLRHRDRGKQDSQNDTPSDYREILWLSERGYLNFEETATLIRRITREVFEAMLCLPDSCRYGFINPTKQLPEFCQFNLALHIQQCRRRLQAWGVFTAELWSSYQRLYLVTEKNKAVTNLTTQQNETICKLLKGLNFRQIGALIDRDELVVAKILYPSILDKTIVVRDPKPPFHLLPPLPETSIFDESVEAVDIPPTGKSSYQTDSSSKETLQIIEKSWKIACVDDSKEIRDSVQKILDRNLFDVLAIEEPMNAFAELIKYQPDLIFLDVDMPNISGYELCTLLRNHRDFKTTPIIMLAKDLGSIDLIKSKLVGATDSLSKPFTQIKLFNIIFRYIK